MAYSMSGKDLKKAESGQIKKDSKEAKPATGNPFKKNKKDPAQLYAMGGNVAKYYGKGGKVAGCGPAQNKS
jgi:hypothetical protein